MGERQTHPRPAVLLVAVLTAVLAAGTATWADDPERTAEREVAALKDALDHERIRRGLESVAAQLRGRDAGLADALASRTARLSMRFTREHAGAELRDVAAELLADEIRAGRIQARDLPVDLKTYKRFSETTRFAVLDPARVPATTSAYEPPVEEGFSPEARALDTASSHSLVSVDDYIADRLTGAVVERLVEGGARVEVHHGQGPEALQSLVNRGFRVLGEVRPPNGSFEKVYLAQGPDSSMRYVVTGAHGSDRVFQLEALLRHGRHDGRRVLTGQVLRFGDPETNRDRTYEDARRGLAASELAVEKVLVGFRSEVHREMERRAAAQKKFEGLREVFGDHAHEGLLRALEREAGEATGARRERIERVREGLAGKRVPEALFRLEPGEVFRSSVQVQRLEAYEIALRRLRQENPGILALERALPDGKEFPMAAGVDWNRHEVGWEANHGRFVMYEYLYTGRDGKLHSLKVVGNYYGDAMGEVVRALLDSGARHVGYLGTAGGIGTGGAADVRVGDLHIPSRVYAPDGSVAGPGVTNAMVDMVDSRAMDPAFRDRLLNGSRVANVRSPLEETAGWLRESRARGVNAVEVELSHVVDAIARHDPAGGRARLHAALIVSDVPGTDETLERMNPERRRLTFSRTLDVFLEALGVGEVHFVERPAEALRFRPRMADRRMERAYELAEGLVGGEPGRRSLVRDNVALVLAEGLSGAALDRADPTRPRLEDLPLGEADRERIRRELSGPLENRDVLRRLEAANAVFSRLARALPDDGGRRRLALAGDLAEGRFGASSDLVVAVEGGPRVLESVRARAEALNARRPEGGVRIEVIGADAPPARAARIEVGDGLDSTRRPGYLTDLYADVLVEARGVRLYTDWAARPVVEYPSRIPPGLAERERAPRAREALPRAPRDGVIETLGRRVARLGGDALRGPPSADRGEARRRAEEARRRALERARRVRGRP
ncbi:MAG: hypothetical protein HY722_07715 [Planctomycetes bacterium]|nr:hypothetical protein [Planctomycetota bacterium]